VASDYREANGVMVRRSISLVCALALTIVGGYSLFYVLSSPPAG
jgi:hypothetical protein